MPVEDTWSVSDVYNYYIHIYMHIQHHTTSDMNDSGPFPKSIASSNSSAASAGKASLMAWPTSLGLFLGWACWADQWKANTLACATIGGCVQFGVATNTWATCPCAKISMMISTKQGQFWSSFQPSLPPCCLLCLKRDIALLPGSWC